MRKFYELVVKFEIADDVFPGKGQEAINVLEVVRAAIHAACGSTDQDLEKQHFRLLRSILYEETATLYDARVYEVPGFVLTPDFER